MQPQSVAAILISNPLYGFSTYRHRPTYYFFFAVAVAFNNSWNSFITLYTLYRYTHTHTHNNIIFSKQTRSLNLSISPRWSVYVLLRRSLLNSLRPPPPPRSIILLLLLLLLYTLSLRVYALSVTHTHTLVHNKLHNIKKIFYLALLVCTHIHLYVVGSSCRFAAAAL